MQACFGYDHGLVVVYRGLDFAKKVSSDGGRRDDGPQAFQQDLLLLRLRNGS
jgi:hypothetical protein